MNKPHLFYQSQDKIIFYSVGFSLLSALIIALFFAINAASLSDQIPLYYSLPWGQPELAKKSEFLILPSLVTLITLINLIISWHLHLSQLILKRILNVTSAIIALLILITAFKIIFIFT